MLHSSRFVCWFQSALIVAALTLSSSLSHAQAVETGTFTVTENWSSVLLSGSMTNPVVVASLPTTGSASEAVLQIRGVSPVVFQMRLVRPSTHLGVPAVSQVAGWLAVEAGTHTFGSTTIAAGVIPAANSIVGNDPANFETVVLPAGFDAAPVVLAATQTANVFAAEFRIARAQNVTTSSFDVGFQVQEDLSSTAYGPESLGWVAWEPGTEIIGSQIASAAVTPDAITHIPSSFSFTGFDPGTLLADGSVFGMLNRFDGTDPAWAAGFPPSGVSVDLYVGEDTSFGEEILHGTEALGVIAFAPAPPPPVPALAPLPLTLIGIAFVATGARAARRIGAPVRYT